ncbi:PREDICTED: uncharacterized protein LOC108571616 isoform X1 [Habropoda laboriosa]|nr:PREDICTED: uncharacterized protein LOC108571616 isoform X1 [Habropoda laboriosa]
MTVNGETSSAQWALDLLEPTPDDYKRSFYDYWPLATGFLTGAGGSIVRNMLLKLPLHTGAHITVFSGAICTLLGCGFLFINEIKKSRKDAVLRDYIRLHPERFPAPQNRKFADMFEPWVPVR